MKKLLITFSLIIYLLCFPISVFASLPITDAKQGLQFEYTPEEGSVEELYKDIIAALIEPYITNEVEKHYGQLLQYDLFDIQFLNIERPSYRSFTFLVKLKVRPFVGAHNIIGIDNITMKISPLETKVEKFEHMRSFPIPPHLKEYYKNVRL